VSRAATLARFPARGLACVAALLLLGLLSSCGGSTPSADSPASLRVFVGVLPHKFLVDRVGGTRVSSEALVQPGQDPHTFEPTPRQVASLAGSTIYFRSGLAFEDALIARMRSSFPALRIVDTQEGITLARVDEEEDGESHGEGLDPHVWMDPLLAKRQALTIRDALEAADPAGKATYEEGYLRLASDLDALHGELGEALAPLRGRELLVFHPAFGYFARAYGLTQVAVETAGKEPSARELARLIDRCRSSGARVVFVQPQFSQAGARSVADAIGGVVEPLDDLAYDYTANLRSVASRVREALGGSGGR